MAIITKKGNLYVLKDFFGNNYISFLFLIIAIILKIILFAHFFSFDDDKLLQALAAKNFVEGKGLTLQHVNASDLSLEIYDPLIQWPPGYSLLMALFYKICGNLLISSFVIDILFTFLFLIVLQKILKLLQFPAYLNNIIILFNGASIGAFLSAPTDLAGVAICLWALYMALLFFSDPKREARYGLWIGLVNTFSILLRYMYLSFGLILPLLLLWTGIQKKDNRMKKGGFYALFITIGITAGWLILQKIYAGNFIYITPGKPGFFWKIY